MGQRLTAIPGGANVSSPSPGPCGAERRAGDRAVWRCGLNDTTQIIVADVADQPQCRCLSAHAPGDYRLGHVDYKAVRRNMHQSRGRRFLIRSHPDGASPIGRLKEQFRSHCLEALPRHRSAKRPLISLSPAYDATKTLMFRLSLFGSCFYKYATISARQT